MNISQLSEQLKDVPQGTLIGYAKNPNSVVPQFLALAEIQRRQQLQAPTEAPSSTVANDVLTQATTPQMPPQMAQGQPQGQPQAQPTGIQGLPQQPPQQAQQLPENQPGVAQLPTGMGKGFANGGIVAFAGNTDGSLVGEEDEDYQDYLDKVESTKRRSGIAEMYAGLKDRVAGISEALPKSYEETKKDYAGKDSLDKPEGIEKLLSTVRQLESGGKHYDSKGNILTSPKGAEGIMQVMPHTQRDPGFGVAPAKDKSPQELQRVGDEYMTAMLNHFKDPKLAAMAYNWGPGNVQKWLASDRKMPVPSETRQYASHFAEGGIASIPRFDGTKGSQINEADYDTSSSADDRMFAAPPPVGNAQGLTAGESIVPDAPRSPFLDYLDELKQERADVLKQHENDKKLALLQAGLSMMGGTSPYAMANIGQGGAQGVAAYGASQKQKAVELAGLRKSQLGTMEAQHLYDYHQDQLKSLDENRQERLKLGRDKLAQAGDIAEQTRLAKVDALTTQTLAAAGRNPQYKYYTKQLENSTPGSPEYEQAVNALQAIEDAYLKNAGIKSAKPISIPQLAPKEEEPSFLKDIFTKAGKQIFGGPSAAPSGSPVGTYVPGKGIVYNQ
jgi:hypothetical protein